LLRIQTELLVKGEAERALAEFSRTDVDEGDDEYWVKGQALALYALGRRAEYLAKLDN
jgi:hypothetical protein